MADSDYGMKVKDASGNTCVITPELGTVISAGRVTMPNSLVDTNKYYTSIDLPGSGNISYSNLTVLSIPVKWTPRVYPTYLPNFYGYPSDDYYWRTFVLDNNYSYYTKNESTGVLTSHTAGARTYNSPSAWHAIISAYPIVYWETLGDSQGTDVKIFAATCYALGRTTDDGDYDVDISNDFVYSIYTNGVEEIDYIVILKKYNY